MPFELTLGAWVAAGLTLFILTFLYEDNPLFKLAEHLYVGVSVGYIIVKAYDTVIIRLIYKPMVEEQDWSLVIPVCIGLLMLARYSPKIAWLSRYAFAFVVGVSSGLAIPRVISSYILRQVEDTVRPLLAIADGGELQFTYNLLDPSSHLNVVVLLVGVVSVLFYFFFSIEHSGLVRTMARTGILFLMISFGAAFGYTVMARMSLLIGRLTDLIEFAKPQYGRPTLWLLLGTIVILAAWGLKRQKSQPPPAGAESDQL